MSMVVWTCEACGRVEPETARWSGRDAQCLGFPPDTAASEWHDPAPFERRVALDELELSLLRAVTYGEGPAFDEDEALRWRHVKVAIGFEDDE